jgi:hypothetical protein
MAARRHLGEMAGWLPASEADAVYLRVLWLVLPIRVVVHVIACIDRWNVGFAELGFMRDLGFSDTVLGIGPHDRAAPARSRSSSR